mgnify:CR=1 FL=1
MTRWGMVIDLDRCTACQACVVACQVENNIPPTGADEAQRGRAIAWIRLARMEIAEHGRKPGEQLVPLPCMHCEHPPCVKVCPATVIVPLRVNVLALLPAVYATVPFPLPLLPEVIVAQPTLLVAVHAHPPGAFSFSLPHPPLHL